MAGSDAMGNVVDQAGQPWWVKATLQAGALGVLALLIWTSHEENMATDLHHNIQMTQCLNMEMER